METLYFPTNNDLFKVNKRNTNMFIKVIKKTSCFSVSVVEQAFTGGVISLKQIVLYLSWTSDSFQVVSGKC